MNTALRLESLPGQSWRVSDASAKQLQTLLEQVELTAAKLDSLNGRIDSVYEGYVRKALPKLGFDHESMNYDCVQTSGRNIRARIEKAAILWTHHLQVVKEQDPKKGLFRDVEMLTSRWADRQMDVGAVAHLMDGFFVVDALFTSGGACVSVLKGMHGQPAKIVCRGTAFGLHAEGSMLSVLDDLSEQIGQNGVQAVWPELKSYIDSNGITHVEILGKSLGGGHAQALAVLLEGHGVSVDHLVTYVAVGVGREVNDVFSSKILESRHAPFKITVLRSGGESSADEVDYVPLVGGVHLGLGAPSDKVAVRVYYLGLANQQIHTPDPEVSLLQIGSRLVRSLIKVHSRQTTWQDFHWKKIADPDEVQKELALGEVTEVYRQPFARLLVRILPSMLRHESFAEYFAMNC